MWHSSACDTDMSHSSACDTDSQHVAAVPLTCILVPVEMIYLLPDVKSTTISPTVSQNTVRANAKVRSYASRIPTGFRLSKK